MAQDYWRGGWADFGQLPGSQAARTAQAAGGQYGPLNAVADILGAYMMKRNRDKANKEIDEYEAGFDSAMAPAPQVPAPTVMDGLMQRQGLQEAAPAQAMPETKPLSWNEYRSKAKSMQSQLLRKLQRERGLAVTPELVQYVQDVTDNKINAYGQQKLGEMNGAFQTGNWTQQNFPQMMKQVMEYNNIANAIGVPTIDMNQMIAGLANKVANVDTGGRIQQVAAPANGLPIYNKPVIDQSNGNIVGYQPVYTMNGTSYPKSLSPAQKAQALQAAANAAAKQRNEDRNYNLNVWKAQNSADNARAKNALDREKYEYLRDNGLYGKKGGSGKMSAKAQSYAVKIKEAAQQAMADIQSGEAYNDKVHSVRDLHELIQEAKESGHVPQEDIERLNDLDYATHFYYSKYAGDEDNAALAWQAISDDYKKKHMSQY